MTKATNNVARVAAAVAGFSLVASAFAPVAFAQTATTATTTTTTTTTASYTRDLTLGSTGADVTALQTWLISKGFTIAAGATGYFGAQTKAALASYQASAGITPAAGYFGPITRANLAGSTTTGGSTTTTGGTTTTTTTLSGGEADLRNYDFLAEDGSGNEGETDVEIATAEFDVEGGDVQVQRAELTFESTATNAASERPWDYFDTISVWADGKKLGDVDADSRSDWDEDDDGIYIITLSGFDYVVEEGETAELTFAADISDNLDSDDITDGSFEVYVDTDGIRAIDAAGIQQYVGRASDSVDFDFDEADNGDLSVRESSENPDDGILEIDDNDNSDEMDVVIGEVRNTGDADSLVTDMTFTVSTTTAIGDLTDVVRRANLDFDGDTYRGDVDDSGTITFDDMDVTVDADDTVEFTLSVELAAASSAFGNGDTLTFDLDGDDVDAEGADSGDETEVSGSISGSTFTISESGIEVNGSSNSSSATTLDSINSSYGSYTIKFEVTAGDDDLFIPVGAATSTGTSLLASTTGVVYDTDAADDFVGTSSPTLTSSADKTTNNAFFIVRSGDSETFTLTVILNPTVAGTYEVDINAIRFDTDTLSSTAPTSFDVSSNDDFETNPVYIPS